MLLAVDIGNTNVTLGVFAVEGGKARRGPARMWRMSSDVRRTPDEYGTQILDFLHYALINKEDISSAAISGVVPHLDGVVAEACASHLGKPAVVFSVKHFAAAKLPVSVDNPSEVGVDRLMNALAVREIMGAPSIAVDFGTALTFDCVGRRGDYVGGVILPGPQTAVSALAVAAAKLPQVALARTRRAVGRNTAECIQSGVSRGYPAMIRKFIRDIRSEIGASAKVAATGGLAGFFKEDIKEFTAFIPELTLEGVRILWNKINQDKNGGSGEKR